ncbi:DUF4145 domain-containing protein [Herbaspirillum aquaticum]|uniref:DUF4145 domain-containing protein n=1 Tax=Herbaspirillum aquaticum TaxID=568783 RepID=UPI0024DEA005|nr:DUF4145 domain-containing protein [Herbaspirillum aquaticum]
MKNKYIQRFEQLQEEIRTIDATKKMEYSEYSRPSETVDSDLFAQWRLKAKNLLVQTCGKDSVHFQEFERAESPFIGETYLNIFNRLKSVFFAAKDDYEGGFLVSVRVLVEAELFDSELDQARHLLTSGYVAAAAVTTRVVLETALRQLCQRNGIALNSVERMNADLVKAAIYNSLQQKRITYLAGIGNSAAHGDLQSYKKEDVQNMIQETEQLIAAFTN